MKNLLLLVLCFLSAGIVFGQRKTKSTIAFGPIGGFSYYIGDVNMNKHFYARQPIYGGILRYGINPRQAIKASLLFSNLQGNDLDFDNYYQQQRNHNFSNKISEFSLQFEFNFFEFKYKNPTYYATPYLAAGAGLCVPSGTSKPTAIIPFGMGLKVRLSNRVCLGGEYIMRKTFSDDLDHLADNYFREHSAFPFKQKNYTNNNDWYASAKIFLTICISSFKMSCPAYSI